MAINGRFTVSMDEAFPAGLYVTSEVEPVRDFEKSSRETPVQALDKESGLRLWEFTVADPDPEARKNSRQLTVKIAAEHQPVPPEAISGTPFRPVVLEGIEVRPYIKDGPRPSIAYSIRASGMGAPQTGAGSTAADAARRSKSTGAESAEAA
jgi:hypothetical protein